MVVLLAAALLLLLQGWQAVDAACNTYASKCTVPLGSVWTSLGQPVTLATHQAYYLTFTPPQSGSFVDIDLSVFYGSVQIFVAKGREPTLTDFDLCTSNDGESDYMHIPFSGPETRRFSFNVMLYADQGQTLFTGAFVSTATPVTLIPGIPINFHMDKNSQLQLRAPVSSRNGSSVSVTAMAGNMPRLTAKLPSSVAQVTNHGILSLSPQASDIGKNVDMNLLATNKSVLSVLYVDNPYSDLVPSRVQDGIAQRDRAAEHKTRFYTFAIPPGMDTSIQFILDPIDGDVDLYINPQSRGWYHRERSLVGPPDPFPVWASQRQSGPDSVLIDHTDSNYMGMGGLFYMSVYAEIDATFILRVTMANTVATLLESVPTSGTLRRGQYTYYRFYDHNPTEGLFVDVLPSYGDADIFISCTYKPTGDDSGIPSKLHNNFSSAAYWEDTVSIAPTNPAACGYNKQAAIYYIAIYSFMDCAYTVTAMHDGGTRVLSPGIYVQDTILTKMTSQYVLRNGFEAQSLTITLSPLYGDCDVYVRVNAPADLYHYDYHSVNIGSATDRVYIPETAICTDCYIYIAVYAVSNSEYTLLAAYSDDTIKLINGLPMRGSVQQGSVQYYTYIPSINANVIATITTLGGRDVRLFASREIARPNATSWLTERSDVDAVVPQVTVVHVPAQREVHIGVSGVNASFLIRVYEQTTERNALPSMLTLYEGVPQSESIILGSTPDWVYYAIYMPMGHESISIRATEIVGQLDLYVRKCTETSIYGCAQHALPTTSNYTYTTLDQESDLLSIIRNDDLDTVYMIGATTSSVYAAYQIVYTIENGVTEVSAGMAVRDHVAPGEFDYFSYYHTEGVISITLTTTAGDPDLYVSTKHTHPSAANSTWRGQRFGGDTIDISPDEPNYCSHCTYYIAVYGMTESAYTLLVTTHANMVSLHEGIPQSGHVDMFKWQYYIFPNPYGAARDFHVTLQSLFGNSDVYISLDDRPPTLTHFDYSSTHWFTSDSIFIRHTDEEYASCLGGPEGSMCNIYVGVYGVTPGDYLVTLSSNMTAVLLQEAVPTHGTVTAGDHVDYKIHTAHQNTYSTFVFRFTVVPITGHVSLYLSCNSDVDRNTYMWYKASIASGDFVDVSSLSFEDHHCLRNTDMLYAYIYGDSNAAYTITGTILNNNTAHILLPSVPASGSVRSGDMNYYYVQVSDHQSNLDIMSTVIQGDVDVYVAATWDSRPVLVNGAVTSFLYKSDNTGGDDLVITHTALERMCANRGGDCYFVVAIYGVSSIASTYNLYLSPHDATVTLLNGVPVTGLIYTHFLDYYVFHLATPGDVYIDLTSISGDPDLFIGIGIPHPGPNNFTYAHMNLGDDDVTLQYDTIQHLCKPGTVYLCDIYIGVYAWTNTTYLITAGIDEGFASPYLLLDGVPSAGVVRQGMYRYYTYHVSPASHNLLATAIYIHLTPTDGGDLDIYIKIDNSTSTSGPANPYLYEPGKDNYDYKSTSWSSVAEDIRIESTMPLFCTECTIHIAVHGYTNGGYLLQGTTEGVLVLASNTAIGGHVDEGAYSYFSVRNTDIFGELYIQLTVLSGDADIYINTQQPGEALKLPTRTDYMYRSMTYGSDAIYIDYNDDHYCTNCNYIVGVYGFRNTTYTMLYTHSEASIVRLVASRPQHGSLAANEKRHYSTVVQSSLADVTISLTSYTGVADLYVYVYNSTDFNTPGGSVVMPDPSDPRTYTYTTANSQDDHVFIPGPHVTEKTVVITVVARQPCQYLIVATAANRPVLLLSGKPQSHFVDKGQNELFVYYPEVDDDLIVTITARSGDPDLFISSTQTPSCSSGANPWDTVCSNFTYTSRTFSGDQIIISKDSPCDPVLPSTYVASTCDIATAYRPDLFQPLYINVFGYIATKFSVLAAPLSLMSTLLPGQPQYSYTHAVFICAQRDERGVCKSNPSNVKKKVQSSFFAFIVPKGTKGDGALFNVLPQCNHTADTNTTRAFVYGHFRGAVHEVGGQDVCNPGCACAPLNLYISSCADRDCTYAFTKPSSLSSMRHLEIDPEEGSSIHIASGTEGFCDPRNDDCYYYLAVEHASAELPGGFTITAQSPQTMALVPCVHSAPPDGIVMRREDVVVDSGGLYYEVCGSTAPPLDGGSSNHGREAILVEVEPCWGDVRIYACTDSARCGLPTNDVWQYQADQAKTCIRSSGGSSKCTPNFNNKLHLTLPPSAHAADSIFLLTNGSVGARFSMQVQQTVRGVDLSPRLVLYGASDATHSVITTDQVTGNTASLRWAQARVYLPGMESAVSAENMKYLLYFFDLAYLDRPKSYVYTSQCGLDHLSAAINPAGVLIFPASVGIAERGQYVMTHTVSGLLPNHIYRVSVVAVCDAVCLRQLGKTLANPHLLTHCYGAGDDCKSQTYVYSYTSVSTASHPDSSPEEADTATSGASTGTIAGLVLLVALVVIVAGGAIAYYYKVSQDSHAGELPGESSHGFMELVGRFMSPSSGANGSGGSVSGSSSGSGASSYSGPAGSSMGEGVRRGWNTVLGNLQQGASSLASTVRSGASALSQRAGGPLAARDETQGAQTGNTGWSVPKPVWGTSTTGPGPGMGSKAYRPVRGDFSIDDDEELEVSL